MMISLSTRSWAGSLILYNIATHPSRYVGLAHPNTFLLPRDMWSIYDLKEIPRCFQ